MKTFTICCSFSLLLLFCLPGRAQYKPKRKQIKGNGAETTQWWIGAKVGSNLSAPLVEDQFDIFSFTDVPLGDNGKVLYDRYKTFGYQFGFILGFEFIRHISAVAEPAFSGSYYSYKVNYLWTSIENQAQNVRVSFEHQNRLQYFEVPLALKYELLHDKLKPYVQGGTYWGKLLQATKDVEESLTDNASGTTTVETNSYAGRVEKLYEPSVWGIFVGAGCTYNVGNARLGLQVNYKMGMKNIAAAETRFEDSQFVSGTFDAHDNLKLNQLELSFVVIMPLKFITSKDYVPL